MPAVKRGGGRPAGSPNKATADARKAIALFVDENAHRLTGWLDKVADGVKVYDADTESDKYVVPPNPAKAFDMFQSVVEYHIPKLARQEHVGVDDQPIVIENNINVFGELLKSIKMKRQAE